MRVPTRTTSGPPAADARPTAPYLFWLAVTAIAYGLTHHIGFGLAWLGNAGETRWADWADLITPYAVLLPAAAALRAGGASPRLWIVYLAGALTYVEGHGIHLAANSVSNADPSDLVHLWDEVVGHYLWYGGLSVVFAALAAALAHRPPVRGPVPAVLALVTGVTFTTNALEGGTAIAAIAVTAAFTAWGWRTRRHLGRLMIGVFAPALLLLIAYGILHGGFPEPSDIGWV
ncbi:hypothetical protein SMC26_43880 [Actinomadura fulvescens]|uniref:Integral membrane protein n=1 Tax=Actinomadura fulvescens TaxID=46160 RepID=A0ABP6C323_9ACTN